MPDIPRPRCVPIAEARRFPRVALRSLRFDGVDLVVELQGTGFLFVRVVFRAVIGFRALDERDLGEFWPEYSEPNGWLWEVRSGGWVDVEKTRPVFNSHEFAAPL